VQGASVFVFHSPENVLQLNRINHPSDKHPKSKNHIFQIILKGRIVAKKTKRWGKSGEILSSKQ